jgi:dTDP-4-dehydrorhamnose reductase
LDSSLVKILVIGASGQVGRHVVQALPAQDVVAPPRAEADLRRPETLEKAIRDADPEAVNLAAAVANPDVCEEDPGLAYALNIDGARAAAEASRGRHFILLSTDHVFDGRSGPNAEDDAPAPINVYGRTKLEAERIVLTVHRRSAVARTSLVFAPGDRSFFSTLLRATAPVNCWTDQRSTPTWGPALGAALVELAQRGETGIWHLAGPDVLDRHAFALKVAKALGKDAGLFRPVTIREAPPRAPRPLQAGLRTDKARAALRTRFPDVDEALALAAGRA